MNARVVPAGGPTFCPGFQYVAEGLSIPLGNANVDLEPFVGEVVLLRGATLAIGLCPIPIFQVESVEPATATLDACGTAQAGCPIRFSVGPSTISINQLWASIGAPGLLPLGDPLGTLNLTAPLVFVGSHSPGGFLDVPMPNLVSVPLTFQGFHREVGPIVNIGSLSNPIRVDISPPGGPFCLDPSACF